MQPSTGGCLLIINSNELHSRLLPDSEVEIVQPLTLMTRQGTLGLGVSPPLTSSPVEQSQEPSVTEGGTAILQCIFSKPPKDISWTKVGKKEYR